MITGIGILVVLTILVSIFYLPALSGNFQTPGEPNPNPIPPYQPPGNTVPTPPPDTTPTYPPIPSNVTYAFGAKFEPPDGRVLYGIGPWKTYEAKLLAAIPSKKYYPASQLIFMDLTGSRWTEAKAKFPSTLAGYDAAGVIPHYDIALTIGTPLPAEQAVLTDPHFGVDDDVANSTKYDAKLNDLADIFKKYKKPVMIRIGGEFNGPWKGYHPYEYPKAFRKIVNLFRAKGVDNVAFIWAYMPAAPDDFDEKNSGGEYKWFPGDDVIDWYGIDIYSPQEISGAIEKNGVLTAFGKTTKFMNMANAHHKPVIMAESGVAKLDITSSLEDGKADWDAFFKPLFAFMTTNPQLKWFHFLNFDWTKDKYYLSSGWKNSDITENEYITEQFIAEIQKPKYLHSDERYLLKDYIKYE